MVGRPSRIVLSGRKALSDCREWSASPLEVSEVGIRPSQRVGRPSRCISRPPGVSGVVVRPSQSVLSGRQALAECRECSTGPPGVSGVVGRPCRCDGSGRQSLPECRQCSEGPRGVSESSRRSRGSTELCLMLTEGPTDTRKVDGWSLGCTES